MPNRIRGRTVSFRVTDEEHEHLLKLAAQHGNNLSEIARIALFNLLSKSNLEQLVDRRIKGLEDQTRALLFELKILSRDLRLDRE